MGALEILFIIIIFIKVQVIIEKTGLSRICLILFDALPSVQEELRY